MRQYQLQAMSHDLQALTSEEASFDKELSQLPKLELEVTPTYKFQHTACFQSIPKRSPCCNKSNVKCA